MVFDNWSDVAQIVLSTIAAYVAIVVILRVSGKRSLSKLNAFDFVVTIALGSVLASTLLLKDTSLADGAAALAMLALLQYLVTWLSIRWRWFADVIRSEPRLLLADGKFIDAALEAERVTRNEVEAAIRKDGHGRVEDIAAVVLESDGSLSVISDGRASECSALRSVIQPPTN